ncbi:MAG: hypothetical protein ACR2QS_17205, partial [Woeseiaceae bacterium]
DRGADHTRDSDSRSTIRSEPSRDRVEKQPDWDALSEIEEKYSRQTQLGASLKDKDKLASGAIDRKS